MKRILNVGDVFTIPVGDGRVGVGQVVALYGESSEFFVVFNRVIQADSGETEIEGALQSGVLFLALSSDAKVHAGDWPIVGNALVDPDLVFPSYKITVDTGAGVRWEVEDAFRRESRPATPEEVEHLHYRGGVSPAVFEHALRATLGLQPWSEYFDKLLYTPDAV